MADETPANLPARPAAATERKRLAPRQIMVEAMRELVTLGADNPRMPEHKFREFLRYLYDPKADRFNIALWRTTFGPTRKGIDITDPEGNVLFICPPLGGTVATLMDVAPEQSLASLAELSELNAKRHAALGARMLAEGLDQYAVGQVMRVDEAWREVLRRYDMLPQTSPAGGTPGAAEPPINLLTGPEEEL